jgi:hypothetical protein
VRANGGIGFNFNGDQLVLFSGVLGPSDPLSKGLFKQNLQDCAIGTLSVISVPEPGKWALLLCGLLRLGVGLLFRENELPSGS